MNNASSLKKDHRRISENTIYTSQKIVWAKANIVCDQLINKTSNKANVFAENFMDFIYGMFGEIKETQTREYKQFTALQFNPKKNVCDVLEQSKNRIRNLYVDTRLSNTVVYAEIRSELTEMKKLCLRMNHKFRN